MLKFNLGIFFLEKSLIIFFFKLLNLNRLILISLDCFFVFAFLIIVYLNYSKILYFRV
jgi:hypothetical protein